MINGYIAVGNKCAVDFHQLGLPIPQAEALKVLWHKGFRVVNVDPVALVRTCLGTAKYKRGANISEAPYLVDCSTLTKWIYGKTGIWLPRHSIDQRDMGEQIPRSEVKSGDLIFVSGFRSYWRHGENIEIGHVGICSGEGTVIHACNSTRGVVEDSIEEFLRDVKDGGIRRIKTSTTITLESPSNRMVECSSEFRQILHPDVYLEPVPFPEVCHPFE
jgi:hypothetical protein